MIPKPSGDLWKNVPSDVWSSLYDIQSEYPDGLDFRPGRELHDKLVRMLVVCADRGYSVNSPCTDEYIKIDQSLDCYMSPSDLDRRRKGKDARKPVNIVIPQQFANLDIFKTGMHKAFFSGKYIHRYQGHGSPERAAKAVIANEVIALIGSWFGHRRSLDIHWGDCFSYGRGWMWGKWSKRLAPSYKVEQVDDLLSSVLQGMGGDYKKGDIVRYLGDEMEVTKEGTDWIPIDPYQVLIDPCVTPDRFQQSEFFGWASRIDALLLMQQESDPEENLFNTDGLRILAKYGGRSRFYREHDERESRLYDESSQWKATTYSSNVDIVYMMMRIVPKDWGLGDSKNPQLWMFGVACDRLLIMAHQIRDRHGLYPVLCSAPNARGHQANPVSHLMMTSGIAAATDYLVKRRLDFLDTAHNGKFIIDPTKLEYKDFKDSDGGPTIVRMKKTAFGSGRISDWYEQIRVDDVTANTWTDVSSLIQMARDGSGIQDVLLGSGGNLPERPTATGIDALQGGAISRLTRAAIILDEQCHRTKGYIDLCNASQYLDSDVIVQFEGQDLDIVANWYHLPPEALGLQVNKWDIDPNLESQPMSNVSQGARSFAAMTEFAKTIMPQMVMQPGALQAFMPFVSQYMREMGIDDFDYVNVTVAPDQMVAQQQQQGNLQPMGMPQQQPQPQAAIA